MHDRPETRHQPDTLHAPTVATSTGRCRSKRLRLGTTVVALSALAASVTTFLGAETTYATTTYEPSGDLYSMASQTANIGARQWWSAGFTGRGIDVAVIDTGVSPVPGLDAPGKVLHGPDLSLESQSPDLQNLDTFGHGTFMAGLIAGRDSSVTSNFSSAPPSAYLGVAPEARIVSLKVGTADGGTDVTQVIAAINWVIQNRNTNGLNIRVLNLSYGTNSKQPYGVDPLSYAVERAWRAGIVVVVASGNTGYQRGNGAPGLANPAYNPFVIGVGGIENKGTAIPNDDVMGSYSASSAGCGSLCKNPDFVALGSRLQGLRVPNSFIDAAFPLGRLGDRYFRGSGTSQAAAITSGSVALILQKYPSLTPDQVKKFIRDQAKKVPGADSQAQGAGQINLAALAGKAPSTATQKFTASTGTGRIELARGSDRLTRDGVVISGEVDIFGRPIDTAALAAASAAGTTWSADGSWNGNRWTGSGWTGNRWTSTAWAGNAWSGNGWTTSVWSGNRWTGSSWSGNRWTGSSWSGSQWTGSSWSTGGWG